MAAASPLSRLFILRDDEKFLRHVKWELAAGRDMEQGRSCALRDFLALAMGKFDLREAKTGCK